MRDCCVPAYGKVFGERGARRAANRYRRKGLDNDPRWIVDVLGERGLADAHVLELGGGVGALHLELLQHGAASAVNVELSPEWEPEASDLLREHGLQGRVDRRVGDAVQEADALAAADVVVMHRVVCCYPDPDRLMDVAAERTRRFLAVSFPRDRPVARFVMAVANLWLRVRHISFRSYIHPESTIEAAARRRGLRPILDRRNMMWRVSVFERAAPEVVIPALTISATTTWANELGSRHSGSFFEAHLTSLVGDGRFAAASRDELEALRAEFGTPSALLVEASVIVTEVA